MKTHNILIVILILSSCITSKTIVKTGIEEISFGNGGGFTGEVKTYTLTADCKLFMQGEKPKKIKSKKVLELFILAKELKNLDYNESANMYSFIDIKTKEKTNRIVWAYGLTVIDKKVINLYNELLKTTK